MVGNERKGFLQGFGRRFQGFMGKRDLDVISPLQSLGDDVRHFVIFAREGAEGLKQDQAFHFFGKGGGIKQAHTTAQGMTDDRQRFFLQMF